ncbi:peptidase family m20 m25 m40 [Trichoderma arundinaceum]|uniref:Peptidase family m20 m25 m40 n=1 Tax=Trichoderma arundinaceum TaxID=490622 RepID=A0A395N9M4_TRIAR|nr:peptidase family m20 m25 m40 [Trichoderma arundinaceum]
MGRRESRLGIKNLFGRSGKLSKADESLPSPLSLHSPSSLNIPKVSPRSGGFRASLAEMSHWPYGQQVKSELALPTTDHPWDSPHEKPDDGQDASSRNLANGSSSSSGKRIPGMTIAKQPRPTLSTWTLPPLFRAFQQAHKQQTLAAATMPIETLLKLSEKTSVADMIVPLSETDMNVSAAGGGGSGAGISTGDKFRRRNRGDSLSAGNLQWTTKIYILVTAGYLLQYTGDGAVDRLPEKVLRLGKSSVAFATDMIPGRHWVLQVSSTTEDDGAPSTDSRSLLSKLSFRTSEKRHTSNLLMVFESAEDMDDWMTSLRAMVEQLGGKRSLSEAGLPREADQKEDDSSSMYIREKPSLRTIVDRDVIRSTQVIPATPSPVMQQDQRSRACDYSIPVIDFDSPSHDTTYDDKSTTNSIISHDGRQLDNLRDSSHRLSLLSSGQRTILTSTTSSPADSPVRERFPLSADITIIPETARPRPNASVIVNRRTSLQTMGPFVGEASITGCGGDGLLEHHQLFSSPLWATTGSDAIQFPSESRSTPSLGASASKPTGRRFAHIKTSSALDADSHPPSPRDAHMVVPRASLRKLSSIRIGRPLSTVEDQPSPKENSMPERPVTSHHAETRSPTLPAEVPSVPKLPRGRLMSVPHVPQMLGRLPTPTRRLSLVPKMASPTPSPGPGTPSSFQFDDAHHPRRLASFNALRRQLEVRASSSTLGDASPLASPATDPSYSPLPSPLAASWSDKIKRNRSSIEDGGEFARGFSLGFSWATKRTSIASTFSDKSFPGDAHAFGSIAETLPQLSPPPTGPLPPIPSRPSSSSSNHSKMMGRKRSMPRMAMPPPAPPPTCALPPIPQKPMAQV